MDSLFAFTGKDYVILVADTNVVRSIVVYKNDYDKINKLADHQAMAVAGEFGDVLQFAEFVSKNILWTEMKSSRPLSTHAMAHFTRGQLAESLRKAPFNVNGFIAGWDKDDVNEKSNSDPEKGTPSLYYFDYLGTLQKMNRGAHGYAQYFITSTLDSFWKQDLSREEGFALVQKCIDQLRYRLVINCPNYKVKLIDSKGIHVIDPETIEQAAKAQKSVVTEDSTPTTSTEDVAADSAAESSSDNTASTETSGT